MTTGDGDVLAYRVDRRADKIGRRMASSGNATSMSFFVGHCDIEKGAKLERWTTRQPAALLATFNFPECGIGSVGADVNPLE
jgi:hypothetical protein